MGSGGEMKKRGIYGIHNTASDKWYVGQSVDMPDRRNHHFCSLRFGRHANPYLQHAFIKYGEDCFQWVVLEASDKEVLDIKECIWIDYYKSDQPEFGYNIDTGGSHGKLHSKSTKKKISLAHMGKVCSIEHRQNMVLAWKTRPPCSAASRLKMSLSRKGVPLSIEHRTKISEAQKGSKSWMFGRHHSLETRLKLVEAAKHKPPISEATRKKRSESLKGNGKGKHREYIETEGGENIGQRKWRMVF